MLNLGLEGSNEARLVISVPASFDTSARYVTSRVVPSQAASSVQSVSDWSPDDYKSPNLHSKQMLNDRNSSRLFSALDNPTQVIDFNDTCRSMKSVSKNDCGPVPKKKKLKVVPMNRLDPNCAISSENSQEQRIPQNSLTEVDPARMATVMEYVNQWGTTQKMSKGLRRSYDANLKIIVANYAMQTNNCQAAWKYGVTERGPKKGSSYEVEQQVVNFLKENRNKRVPISRDMIRLKAQEIAQELNIPQTIFKVSVGWCVRMMGCCGFSLLRRTSLAQRLLKDFEEKLVAFQWHVIGLRKRHKYLCGQMGNADETAHVGEQHQCPSLEVSKNAASRVPWMALGATSADRMQMTVMETAATVAALVAASHSVMMNDMNALLPTITAS
ncbi:hypothetical protein PR048_030135 [Dryococelus australis]|uniref:HTH CENPB-type domain-containing protein n=1 Tax=Dryococelus australis TaxID=614101 RepID=A0ABQ9G835_9NEOP|nr:hypothetical protein PR048_030135 [Dryococelus australis]